MIDEELARQIAAHFAFPFTADQREAARRLSRFVVTPRRKAAFILRGYAGTGKTSLVGALVKVMKKLKREVVLLAPTGRAAKVFSLHSGMQASTIHRCIYRQQTFNGESTRFSLGYNKLQHALFIVDEASMINNSDGASLFGTGQLLSDLIEYVYSGEGCRLLFVGDEAQLPPVGCVESPALSTEEIRCYGLEVAEANLTEVVRQEEASGVLAGATRLRNLLQQGFEGLPRLRANEKGEVRFLPGSELIEALTDSYSEYGVGGTIVVTRSNKRANIYNNG
ncbi:MAG: AAA family ATPase, partial [Bacteroidaceae bacterium]|nr:AAA family ATPase [Bacteroidaceae bacterium]